jgi:hypothetical protein
MILSTHAIVGAAIASFLPSHPAAAFVLGFASHFILDAIPHWDYPIRSTSVNPNIGAPMTFDRALLQDAITIGSDGLLGILAALLLFASAESLWAILLGSFGAMLPDPLQFAHVRLPHEPLRTIQRFHRWMHTDRQIKVVLGIGSQLALVALIVGVATAAHSGVFGTAIAMAHGNG